MVAERARAATVAGYFVRSMLFGLRDRPERVAALLAQVGISPQALEQPDLRVSSSAFAELWLLAIAEMEDEFFRFDTHGMPLGSFALICRGLIQEPTLERALQKCLAYFALLLTDVQGFLDIRGDHAVVRVKCQGAVDERSAYAEEIFLVLMISVQCWLGGRRIRIDRTQFRHTRPALKDDARLWGPELKFGAEHTEIEFSRVYLRQAVVQNLASLKGFLRNAPQWLVIRFRNEHGLATRVYQRLRESPYDQWPTLIALAREQGVSAATFRRQLEREGASFQGLKDQVRRATALALLADGTQSVARIAEQVGFQEASTFHRAFKKWTGMSPGSFRAENAKASL